MGQYVSAGRLFLVTVKSWNLDDSIGIQQLNSCVVVQGGFQRSSEANVA